MEIQHYIFNVDDNIGLYMSNEKKYGGCCGFCRYDEENYEEEEEKMHQQEFIENGYKFAQLYDLKNNSILCCHQFHTKCLYDMLEINKEIKCPLCQKLLDILEFKNELYGKHDRIIMTEFERGHKIGNKFVGKYQCLYYGFPTSNKRYRDFVKNISEQFNGYASKLSSDDTKFLIEEKLNKKFIINKSYTNERFFPFTEELNFDNIYLYDNILECTFNNDGLLDGEVIIKNYNNISNLTFNKGNLERATICSFPYLCNLPQQFNKIVETLCMVQLITSYDFNMEIGISSFMMNDNCKIDIHFDIDLCFNEPNHDKIIISDIGRNNKYLCNYKQFNIEKFYKGDYGYNYILNKNTHIIECYNHDEKIVDVYCGYYKFDDFVCPKSAYFYNINKYISSFIYSYVLILHYIIIGINFLGKKSEKYFEKMPLFLIFTILSKIMFIFFKNESKFLLIMAKYTFVFLIYLSKIIRIDILEKKFTNFLIICDCMFIFLLNFNNIYLYLYICYFGAKNICVMSAHHYGYKKLYYYLLLL